MISFGETSKDESETNGEKEERKAAATKDQNGSLQSDQHSATGLVTNF